MSNVDKQRFLWLVKVLNKLSNKASFFFEILLIAWYKQIKQRLWDLEIERLVLPTCATLLIKHNAFIQSKLFVHMGRD